MIHIRELSFAYGDKRIFDGLRLTLPEEGTVLLKGPSGCGKTTLLRLLAGLLQPDSGEITGLTRRKIGVVFQQDRLLPWRTALENASLAGDRETAAALLTALGLGEAYDTLPAALSGGMRRRVAIARALTFSEDVVLLDEPFNGLDLTARENAMALIRSRTRLRILSTHIDADEALLRPDATLLFCPGEEGTAVSVMDA